LQVPARFKLLLSRAGALFRQGAAGMNKICLIVAAIFFGIGAIAAAAGATSSINWLCAGLCAVTIGAVIGH